MAKHTVTSRSHRGGKPCVAAGVALEEARQLRSEGKNPSPPDPDDGSSSVDPEEIF